MPHPLTRRSLGLAMPILLVASRGRAQQPVTIRIGRNDYFELTGFAQYGGSLLRDLSAHQASATFSAPAGSFVALAPAFTAGHYDIVLTTASSIFPALIRSPNFKLFGTQRINDNHLHHVILAARDSAIRVPKDLEGRSIAVNRGGTGEYLLKLAVAKYGLDARRITPVYLAPPAAATAFASGQVEAWATFSSFAGNALGKNGARVIASGLDLDDKDDMVLLVTNAFLERYPALVSAVYQSLHAESERNARHPEEAVRALQQHLTLDPAVADYVREDLKDRPAITPITEEAIARFEDVARVYREIGTLKEAIDFRAHSVDVGRLGA